jgi:F-type H+-transporting ATPase subunit gamma
MPSLDDLKKRIKSVKSTQKITKAMKMVAAAKLRKAQENAEKGRPYSQKMQNIILNLTKSINHPQNAPKLLIGTGDDKKYLCVVLTADRGLCGGFNSNICKLAKINFKKILCSNFFNLFFMDVSIMKLPSCSFRPPISSSSIL